MPQIPLEKKELSKGFLKISALLSLLVGVYCDSPVTGMSCNICQKYGKPPATARGATSRGVGTSRGVADWNHATELLKWHKQSKWWHQDGVITARMAEQAQRTGSVIELHLAASAKQIEEERQHNRCVLLSCYDQPTYYIP